MNAAQTMTAWERLGIEGRELARGMAFYMECPELDADLLDYVAGQCGAVVRDAAQWCATACPDLLRDVRNGHG
jgi:hypothetical protein